ncbi:MAG: iron chaperone [Chloroflexota bacterium]|nr:DUF1801 domain-containing protein [Chloroflexota bacterium]MBI5703164.1 DUF1801 domain-containing protein [Chloroflexota bacterium]
MAKTRFQSIDEYIAACPKETHERLQTIRAAIKRIAPAAKEKISYQIAAFELNGRNLVYFAGWKRHVSLYPLPAGDEAFRQEISRYVDGKGTLKFPLDESLPLKLIEKVVRLHVAENKKRAGRKS